MVFSLIFAYQLDNRCGKCKKTKTFDLAWLFHLQDRVAHFVRNPALSTDQPLRGSWAQRVSLIPNSRRIMCHVWGAPDRLGLSKRKRCALQVYMPSGKKLAGRTYKFSV